MMIMIMKIVQKLARDLVVQVFSRRCLEDLCTPIDTCFFCGKPASSGRPLSKVQ